ncbi:hypothetical protein GUITHDRAFT_131848 [Guillardia theta CCMP2712]|uniref:Uncharacterized protein n=1 Tax=Guillardia theta (strain CCMP2712) TaxID=905079 RepID=L1K3C0_GUITC|nr:hypothetical protein GUITHDRAFT_131848 [Guillardia theta CCMP2712]EKX54853.1 hypothetical protein GUITHDRAFT_131848 [Guillardia theta CCMP2712]|eukprot:XP_005841833.1 hypothetical protein GUITHDRAFT_131848 [Guillardia theta CCMP2712]
MAGMEGGEGCVFRYEGHEDDQPLLWRDPLNDLVGALNELMVKRKKKLGPVLSQAANMEDIPLDDEEDYRPRSVRVGPPIKTGPGATGRTLLDPMRWEGLDQDEEWEAPPALGEDGDEYAPQEPQGAILRSQPKEDAKMARREQRKKLKQELIEKEKELQEVRSRISADEVLLRLRKQQSSELGSSMSECHEGEEQANTWIKALEEVFHKRTAKLQEHDGKISLTKNHIEQCEHMLSDLDLERRAAVSKYISDEQTFSNTVKVENKTSDIWRALEEEIRTSHKKSEESVSKRQREHLRLSKHLQDLVVGETLKEVQDEGKDLNKYWKRISIDQEMLVGGAVAQVDAEERARSHLVGHGERIRSKLEIANGNLNAQKSVIEDQNNMDEELKEKTDEVESKIRTIQIEIDELEEAKASLERQRDEVHQVCQDKVDNLNSSLRAIETSANAVATEQVIAQRTLASSEEALETLEESEARARLEEDIEALRQSLHSIESRLHEVQKERAAVRDTRGKTQREAMNEAARLNSKVKEIDEKVEVLLAKRVKLEGEQRQLDGQRVVVHARVKQSKKSVTPLEQERKLYEAELEWVREFEEHSFMRLQEKHEEKLQLEEELAELKKKGSQQLNEQSEDESIVQDGLKAVIELKDKIVLHKQHVEKKLRDVQEKLASSEAEVASLAATMQALDGKILEADDAASEFEEKSVTLKADWETKDLDWRSRRKECQAKLKKEERALSALMESRQVLQEELDEVIQQLSDQRHAASNAREQQGVLRAEKSEFDKLIAGMEASINKNCDREDVLVRQIKALRKSIVQSRVGNRYREKIGETRH